MKQSKRDRPATSRRCGFSLIDGEVAAMIAIADIVDAKTISGWSGQARESFRNQA
jgi:hypothetical protein